MTPLERRPTRRTRAKNGTDKLSAEARLLGATQRLLDQGHRFGTLSVEQLTREAGMSRAAFYLHFRDKGELVARLFEYVTAELVRSTGSWFNDAEHATRKDVQRALSGVARSFQKHQAIFAAINATAPSDAAVAQMFHTMMDTISAQSRRSFRAVRRQGRSRRGATDDVAEVLSWMVVLYCARLRSARKGRGDTARLARTLGYICASVIFATD